MKPAAIVAYIKKVIAFQRLQIQITKARSNRTQPARTKLAAQPPANISPAGICHQTRLFPPNGTKKVNADNIAITMASAWGEFRVEKGLSTSWSKSEISIVNPLFK